MPRIEVADLREIESIYRESHRLWGAGLSRADYLDLWRELSRHPWARRNLRFLVWKDEQGAVLSSLKLYRPRIRLDGEVARGAFLGAVFTPRAMRGNGYAGALIEHVLGELRSAGVPAVLLFSDIPAGYYERFGFVGLPCREQHGRLPARPRMPSGVWSMRALRRADLEAVRRACEDTSLARYVAVVRDAAHWDFLRTRAAGYFDRLGDRSVVQHWRVAFDGERCAGYLVSVNGRRDWSVREVAAVGGAPETLAAILRLGAAEARRDGLRTFHGWLPPEVLRWLDDWDIVDEPRSRAVPMLRAFGRTLDERRVAAERDTFIPFHDQF